MDGSDAPWAVALATLAACTALVLCWPVLRIADRPSINYNEGWNAYRQTMAAHGVPLYASPPRLWITNYPFLSFHLIGLLGGAIGNVVLAGRLVSLASLLALAGLAGGIVRTITGSSRVGLHAGLCLALWIATFTPERRAMNDPALLGMALAALGSFAYLVSRGRSGWLVVSALAFAASLFVKPDLLALPLGVGAHLALRGRWPSLLLWAATGALAAGLLLALTFDLDGAYLFAHLARPRAYRFGNLAGNVLKYVLHFGAVLALCATLRHRRAIDRDLLVLLAITTTVAVALSGGDGVASHIFYPSLLVLAVCSGVLLAASPGRPMAALAIPVLAGAAFVPIVLAHDRAAFDRQHALAGSARRTIAMLRAANGPAICEDLLLCLQSGKPLDADPFFVHDQLATGRPGHAPLRSLEALAEILSMLAQHRYAAIEIDGAVDAAAPAVGRTRFDRAFMASLLSHYRLVRVDRYHSLLEPRGSSGGRP